MKEQWKKIKNLVLSEKYELSLVFAEKALMKKLNQTYRKKRGAADCLSFSLSKTEGEIFILKSPTKKKEAKHLFIHSLLHLKGYEHSDKMDKEEQRLLKKYEKDEKKHSRRS